MPSSQLPLVLITNTVPPETLTPFAGIARVVMGPSDGALMPRAEVLRLAPKLVAIINQAELRVDQELLDRAPNLRIVANIAIGVDNLDLERMRQRGVYATNIPHAFVDSTADFTLGMLLTLVRRIIEADRYVRAGTWSDFRPGVWDGALLRGKTLGLVGYGAIGQAVAHRAEAFGLRVLHYRRTRDTFPNYVPLRQLLQESDFVSLHVPFNAESDRLINAERLQWMKRGAYLINVSRGRVVDEQALVVALQSGHLAGAALDVFESEPHVHPSLPTLANVVLSPHIAGGTRESRHDARLYSAENVARVLSGQRPRNVRNDPVSPINPDAPSA